MNIVKNHCKKCGGFLNNYAGDKEKEIYWFHPDHLGSSSYITGLDGEVTQNIEYFPSGETFVENHRNSNYSPYKFNGKEQDAETGYYYYGARYYNPRVSLWLNVDPMAESLPDWSPYIYTFNNPIKYVDPNGKDEWVRNTDGTYNRVGNRGGDETDYLLDKPGGNVIGTKELVSGYSEFRVLRSYGVGVGTSGGAMYDPSFDIAKEIILSEIVLAWKPVKWITRAIWRPIGKGLSWAGQKVSRGATWAARGIGNIFKKACFVEGTLVLTSDGLKKIENIKEGDLVWSYNELNHKNELKRVVALSINESSEIIVINVGEVKIECTPEHPFYVDGKWVEAKDLEIGNKLLKKDGLSLEITSITKQKRNEKVYNFEVEENHDYYVSNFSILVHNNCDFPMKWSRFGDKVNLPYFDESKIRKLSRADLQEVIGKFKTSIKSRLDEESYFSRSGTGNANDAATHRYRIETEEHYLQKLEAEATRRANLKK